MLCILPTKKFEILDGGHHFLFKIVINLDISLNSVRMDIYSHMTNPENIMFNL